MAFRTWLLRSKLKRLDRKLKRLHALQKRLRKQDPPEPDAKAKLAALTEEVRQVSEQHDAVKAELDEAENVEAASA